MQQSLLKTFNSLLLLLALVGFASAAVANPKVLDSLRVDYVGGSYLEVTFDSTTIFDEGNYNLLLLKYTGVIVTTKFYSGWNGVIPEIAGSPYTWNLDVDASGNATMDFVLAGNNNNHSQQTFYETLTSYSGADEWMNGRSGCDAVTRCPMTSFVLTVSDAPSDFTLTYNAGPNGKINGESSQTVLYGLDGSPVTAEAEPNFHFVNWGDSSTANPRTDTNVKAIVDVTASFAIDNFTVSSSVDGDTGGSISPLGGQQVDWNETSEFTLAPAAGYMVEGVSGTCGGSLTDMTYTTDPITENCTVVANFELKPDLMFESGFEEPPKLVFITSAAYPGGLGGLSGADLKCNTLATAAGLPGTYTAWLSTTSPAINAKDRIGDHTWIRTDGALVADNLADLIDGTIQNKINLDENGTATTASGAWTGTGGNGTFAGNGNPCSGWTGSGFGLRGNPAATDRNWTQSGGLLSCPNSSPIYCFGQ